MNKKYKVRIGLLFLLLLGISFLREDVLSAQNGSGTFTFSSENPAVPIADVPAGSLKVPIYKAKIVASGFNGDGGNLTRVTFTPKGSFRSSDIAKYQFWYNTSDNLATAFNTGADVTSIPGPNTQVTLSPYSPFLQDGQTWYVWITMDLKANAGTGKTLSVNALTTANFTFSKGSKTGTMYAGGKQTFGGGSQTANLNVSYTYFANFYYCVGSGPSTSNELTVTGSGLNANPTATASANYEISNSINGNYSSTLTLTRQGQSLNTKIYVRMKAGLGVGTYTGTVTISGGGAAMETVQLSGNVSDCMTCSGSLGEPIVNETFGSGSGPGGPLSYISGLTYQNVDCPDDGFYAVRNRTDKCFQVYDTNPPVYNWLTIPEDHTPGDQNGYMLMINAPIQPGPQFYRNLITDLCSGTVLKFSAWMLNPHTNPQSILPDVTFNIYKSDGTTLLATHNTGPIPMAKNASDWKQYELTFTMPPGESSVVLQIANLTPGGLGSDIFIDDIQFRACGPTLTSSATSPIPVGSATTLTGTSGEGYTNPQYQWQRSADGGVTWENIEGATSLVYQQVENVAGTYQYRFLAADEGNIGNKNCRVVSPVAQVVFFDQPVVPVTVDKYATPVENPLDPENPNAWDVTLKISTGAVNIPVDVVMVIDQSSSMGGANIARLKSAIKSGQEFVRRMLPKGTATPDVRIALVSYDHEPHKLSDFTKDTTLLCQKIRQLTPVWGTHTQGGLKMARNIMASSNAVYKHIILMSDGLATEQYPIKNVTTADFTGKTGVNDDPIDLVFQSAANNPGSYVSDNPSTSHIVPQYPTNNSKVGKRDLPESKYDYSDLSGRVTFDGVAGPLVYAPNFGSPYYYYFPCNAAINEAQFAKNSGYTIHTIGYDLGNFPLANNSLKLTATSPDYFFTATPQNLAAAFDNIAQNINVGIQQSTVEDIIAPGFIVKNVTQSGDVTHLFNVSHGTIYYNIDTKKLTWTPGAILTSSVATITYRIYADLDYIQNNDIPANTTSTIGPDLGGFDTNTEATLVYTNSNGTPNQHLIFPRPTVKLGYGVIKRHYVLVNKDGQPISADGTVVSSLSEAHVLQPQDFFLPTGGDHVVPKWIKLDKTTEALQYYSVPPSNTIITTADGKRYSFVEVTGSTPNPGQIGISWKKPAGNAYFAYRVLNYWMGGTENHVNEWDVPTNWTGDQVPLTGEDVEFATTENFGTPAVADLYVPATDPKVIGNLINNSGEDLVLVTSSQLTINGQVLDNNTDAGTIVVQSLPDHPSGTLMFTNPDQNQNVGATVEFYNKGYNCADCGMYRRSWQYFGIPLQSLNPFPNGDVAGEETINQWMEPFNGNKWQPATFPMTAFKGYEITNSSNSVPTDVYKMKGTLFVGDATVPLTRTAGVNYIGANLVGNSYTAAIDIKEALTIPTGVEQTIYLFNTGTRDQWRKLDGSTVSGYRAGQYLGVPQHLAGQSHFPDRIPSMHAFLLRMESGSMANLGITYDKLVQNTIVDNGNGAQIVWRSGDNGGAALPFLMMDVLGNGSADRLWIFSHSDMSFGFDDGWDGRKLTEPGISQLYAMAPMETDKFQVAAVPELNGLLIGFDTDQEGHYDLEFALSDDYAGGAVFIHDLHSDVKQRIVNGGSYSFSAKRGDTGARFRLTYSEDGASEELPVLVGRVDKQIFVTNNSKQDYIANVYTTDGKLLRRINVQSGSKSMTEPLIEGVYVVSLQNPTVISDVRKVVID